MAFLDRVKAFLSRETEEARATVDDVSAKLDAELTRREAELRATPEQKLDSILDEIDSSETSFDAIRHKAARAETTAEARAELDAIDGDAAD